jgi:hypothetical protein
MFSGLFFHMDDQAFLNAFEASRISRADWTHRAHVKVAYLYLRQFPLELAIEKVRVGIKALNAANGVLDTPTGGYHETMTLGWVHIVHAMLSEYGPAASADEFIDSQPQLTQKKILRLFYSKERFMSAEAKLNFVEPDLAPLPKPIERLTH